ncbi:indole-3-acetic acid-amido synthetase GH3.10-like isoform X2 [Abrus precatorius]|uniref:Indole-3-acetic acid-amido synthetase GH3.10-like isoform X2 n=1 Tax=Abrus precatorius TaxID=3816 RepID=A0A8B8KUL1_ABRPR|nr:indole-3-acetic acid-amido synthetase GH3.10-like isoform X2 [Abrus precatorius]
MPQHQLNPMEPLLSSNNGNGNSDYDIISWFEDVSKNAGSVQTQLLCYILKQNYKVEYLKKWLGNYNILEMDACALESLFTSVVPLASHAEFEPFIQRIADGDTSPLLTQQPITTLSLRVYPIREGGRILEFIYSSNRFKTKGGLTVGTATTHYYASEEFIIKQHKTKSFTCSPEEVISGGDYMQSTYCHLLLGLFFSDQVEFITSAFVYSIVQAFCSFEELWSEICNDIRDGTLSSRIKSPKMRRAVLDIISPNPNLGLKIEAACQVLQVVDWFGLIPKLWPNAKYVYSIMTGSMQPYLKKLRHYASGLPLVSADYGSTESWIGVNVDPNLPPEDVTFAVVPTFSYFEFIPLHRHKKYPTSVADDFIEDKPIPLSQIKVGQEYEIVLTTCTGLYRCRLGDVVEVAGFHNGTPKLNFVCRRKLILTVNIDKNTEKDLQLVVERGSELLNEAKAELVDFTSYANVSNEPGHYVIYWEIKGEVEDKVLGACCTEMDKCFADHGYVVSRKTNSIGPLQLCIVERGTFKKILDNFIANGAALSQFKTPRCTNNHTLLKILSSSTIQRFRSTAYASKEQ